MNHHIASEPSGVVSHRHSTVQCDGVIQENVMPVTYPIVFTLLPSIAFDQLEWVDVLVVWVPENPNQHAFLDLSLYRVVQSLVFIESTTIYRQAFTTPAQLCRARTHRILTIPRFP